MESSSVQCAVSPIRRAGENPTLAHSDPNPVTRSNPFFFFLALLGILLIACGATVPTMAFQAEPVSATLPGLESHRLQRSPISLILEDFQNETVGTLPSNWFNRDGDARPTEYEEEIRREYQYQIVEEDGNRFLRFEGTSAKHLNFPLLDRQGIDLEKMPILQWRWRVHTLPQEANELDEKRNDVAASVYIVFEIGRVLFKAAPRSVRYTWSSSLEEGTEFEKFFGHQKVVVLQSGEHAAGEWITERVDLVEEYKRLFGREAPSSPLAILILSDGDNTQSTVKADYDDFLFTIRTPLE